MTALAGHAGLGMRDPGRFLDPDLDQMVSSQVDDLVKYQIVKLLSRRPGVVGDASFFAAVLGFHSAEYTQASLEELANCGILQRQMCQSDEQMMYYLSSDPQIRKRIVKLCNLRNKAATYDELLRVLAGRSLQRAAKRAKEGTNRNSSLA
ncbi:MAG: hypothetical protein HYY30_13405 [Chloroflexi bacterium]|nr:hypothetical protein [Chloroflexota bacterium]